jgi:hypothetical protein
MLVVFCVTMVACGDSVTIEPVGAESYRIANDSLARVLMVEKGCLRTKMIVNKLADTKAAPLSCNEFELRISDGTHTTGTDVVLTSGDFKFKESKQYAIEGGKGISFVLENAKYKLTVDVRYELFKDDFTVIP